MFNPCAKDCYLRERLCYTFVITFASKCTYNFGDRILVLCKSARTDWYVRSSQKCLKFMPHLFNIKLFHLTRSCVYCNSSCSQLITWNFLGILSTFGDFEWVVRNTPSKMFTCILMNLDCRDSRMSYHRKEYWFSFFLYCLETVDFWKR